MPEESRFRVFVSAGDWSGDVHVSAVFRILLTRHPETEIQGLGGPAIQSVAGDKFLPLVDWTRLGQLGFLEVVRDIPFFFRLERNIRHLLKTWEPHVALLVDFPGWNLRLLRHLASLQIPTIYYILPQVWAWHTRRIHILRKAHHLLAILPFEPEFYHRYGIQHIEYIGNPVVERIHAWKSRQRSDSFSGLSLPDDPYILLLPGSRSREIRAIFPVMLESLRLFWYHIHRIPVVVAPPSHQLDLTWQILTQNLPAWERSLVVVIDGSRHLYPACMRAKIALVTSGTATLEVALWKVPQIVLYRGNVLSYWIARTVAKVRWISLVNLIAGKTVIPELIQHTCTPNHILEHMLRILENPEIQRQILAGYSEVMKKVGELHPSPRVVERLLTYAPRNRLHAS